MAALNHPNIVAIYDVGEENGVLFLVTELVEGRNLKGPMPIEAALIPPSRVLIQDIRKAKGVKHGRWSES